MDDFETRVCKTCGKEKLIKSFPRTSNGPYRSHECYSCRTNKNKLLGRCSVCYAPVEPGKNRCSKHLELQRLKAKERALRLRLEVLQHYCGNDIKCQCCGESTIEFLTLDHINGDGNKHRKSLRKSDDRNPGGSICSWLKKNGFPDGFQVLCFNCNCAKSIYGVCPHLKQISLESQ